MTPENLLHIIIAILTFNFLLGRIMQFLTAQSWKKAAIPEEVQGLYDEAKYEKARQYHSEGGKVGLLRRSLAFAVTFAFLAFGWYGWLYANCLAWAGGSSVGAGLLFFGILGVLSSIISLPFSLYSNFVIEAKYGFNRMTLGTFFADLGKGAMLQAIIGGGLLSLLIIVFEQIGMHFWWIGWGVMALFSILMSGLYVRLFLPLFNKLTPMEYGALKTKIEEYAKGIDFPVTKIFVMDGSKRSNKANAFFTGLGRQKTIVLYDTLIEKFDDDELLAVLAHEVGHYKRRHIPIQMVTGVLQLGLVFGLFQLVAFGYGDLIASMLNLPSINLPVALLIFGFMYSPLQLITGYLSSSLSRKFEYEADAFAKETSSGEALASALRKLSVEHLSNLNPNKFVVSMTYSHPPLWQRLRALAQN